jgi:hypothetical protein
MFSNLPRDLQLHVVRLLDIDSRRALGIYSKLRIPTNLENKISKTFIRKLTPYIATNTRTNCLWIIIPPTPDTKFTIDYCMQQLVLHPSYNKNDLRMLVMVRSYISSMVESHIDGFVINAGVIDDILYIGFGVPEIEDDTCMLFMVPKWMTPQHMAMFHM